MDTAGERGPKSPPEWSVDPREFGCLEGSSCLAQSLLYSGAVDRGAIAIAAELFECRHYASAVATCTSALDGDPTSVPLLLVRARCHLALRREADAQRDLRDVIRRDARCALAYRLLGELAARRDENPSAAIFFREALRLDPGDQNARDWLAVVEPTHDAPAARRSDGAAIRGHAASREPIRTATNARSLSAPARPRSPSPSAVEPRSGTQARLARGTQPPDALDARPAKPARGPIGRLFTPTPGLDARVHPPSVQPGPRRASPPPIPGQARARPALAPSSPSAGLGGTGSVTVQEGAGRMVPAPSATPRRLAPRPIGRAQTELPGFGEYLVTEGILTRERLRAAQAYQRSMKVQLSTAIVTLGLASPQRVELASVEHQSLHPARAVSEP